MQTPVASRAFISCCRRLTWASWSHLLPYPSSLHELRIAFFPLFFSWQIFWQGHFLRFASGWCDLVTPSAGCSALTPLFLVRPQRKFTVACNNEEGPMITAESDFDFQHVLLGQDISTKAACISWVQTSQKNLWFPLSRRKSGNQELSKGNKLFKSQHTQNKVEVVVVWTNTREY